MPPVALGLFLLFEAEPRKWRESLSSSLYFLFWSLLY